MLHAATTFSDNLSAIGQFTAAAVAAVVSFGAFVRSGKVNKAVNNVPKGDPTLVERVTRMEAKVDRIGPVEAKIDALMAALAGAPLER